jgi:large subunit ribosomal protein L6
MGKQKATKKKSASLVKEITLPRDVTVALNGESLNVKGPKGEVSRKINKNHFTIEINNGIVKISTAKSSKKDKKLLGSLVAHLKNMIRGSTSHHIYTLKVCSGHFPMNVTISGNKISVKNFLGEKIPRELVLKDGAAVKVEGDIINVTSSSKELAGQVSADIEHLTKRTGYDSRIFQDGIYITSKDGKYIK